jgi:hypothetical protein
MRRVGQRIESISGVCVGSSGHMTQSSALESGHGCHVDTCTLTLMTGNKDLKSRVLTGAKRDGHREYDEATRDELVRICLKSGLSIARTAMEYYLNPNQRPLTDYRQDWAQCPRPGNSHRKQECHA